MPDFPFNVPKSLATYAEQFENDPLKVTTKLKKQLEKRGPDAVGYFLLAWFYHVKGIDDHAIQNAIKAKMFAPGSPLMQKLHYYLTHPDTFEAWVPEHTEQNDSLNYPSTNSETGPEPVMDLDNLITRLSEVESEPISATQAEKQPGKDDSDDSYNRSEAGSATDEDEAVDNIASETLAKIHEMQGKTKAAIHIYRRLKKINGDKKQHYQEQIDRLQKEMEEANQEE